jgi:hypothetical protein
LLTFRRTPSLPLTVSPGIADLQTVGGRKIKISYTFFIAISVTVVIENF